MVTDDEDTDDAGSHGSYDDDEALASGLGARGASQ